MRLTVESASEPVTIDVAGEVVIGRGDECDLVLDDEQASRRHASVTELEDGRALLVDLGSRNGTFVGGRRVEAPVELDGDERIRIGNTVIAVRARRETTVAPHALRLRIESGDLRGREFDATGSDFTVGRTEECDLVLPDATVSARHASVAVIATGTGVLTDLGSRNGTFVDGQQIYGPALLSGGERIRFGDTVVSVGAVRASRAATAVAAVGAWLTVDSGPDAGRVVKVAGDTFVVGRGDEADLDLGDASVSRRHAVLHVQGPGRATIVDLGSRNGTIVDGARVEKTRELSGGERLRIGDVDLHFGEGPPPAGAEERAAPPDGGRRVSAVTLARACARRPWFAIGVWTLVLLVCGGIAAASLKSSLTAEQAVGGNPDSKRADRILQDRLGVPRQLTELVVFRSTTHTASDPTFRASVGRLRSRIDALGPDVVAGTRSYYDDRNPAFLSADRRAVLLAVVLRGSFDSAAGNVSRLLDVVDQAGEPDDVDTFVSGEASVAQDFREVADSDLRKGESIGLAVALLVLVFVFGTVVAALLPIVMAIFAIAVALGVATLVAHVMTLSIFVTNMTVGMGLALGIDYTLFVITRYREEREAGLEVADAVEAAAATSGRAVLFSGVAVLLALVGLALVPSPVLRSLGIGAILVCASSVLATLTLLPAWLSLLGDRVERLRIPRVATPAARAREQRFWTRAAELVMRHPVASLVAAMTLLLAAASPLTSLKTGSSGVTTLPGSAPSRQGFEVISREFPNAVSYPVEIVVTGPVGSTAMRRSLGRLEAGLRRDGSFGRPQLISRPARDAALVTTTMPGDPLSGKAADDIRRLRSHIVPAAFAGSTASVLVTGRTARNVDLIDQNTHALPFVLIFVLALSFVLLMLVFRSVVVPAKAVVMNLLSTGAAYGLLVLVIEKGVGAGLLGLRQVDRVEAWVPVFLFAVLFGLSMDYHVFLLSRIRERFNETGDNRAAVAYGITSTARIITGAALIMVSVFGGFALGELPQFQQLGLGMGFALLIDATVVRIVLVPAGMRLLGARNWYLPRWLRWLPEIHVEGAPPVEAAPPTGMPAAQPVT